MFEKEKGNSNINKLRIINQYEADYNVLLKTYCLKITNNIAGKNNTLGKKRIGDSKEKEFDGYSNDKRIHPRHRQNPSTNNCHST